MPVIDVRQFIEGLSSNPGVYFMTIRAKTIPDLKKKGNPFVDRVHKITCANGYIGADYEATTNRKLEKLGEDATFESQPHVWATWVNRHLVTNATGDRYYLRFIQNHRREFWFLDNQPVDSAIFAEWMKPVKPEIVTYRNYMVDHILSFKWRKLTHYITGQRPKHVYPVTHARV